MTAIDRPLSSTQHDSGTPERFTFHGVDWEFYKYVNQKLVEQCAFVTYYKGRLEIVTVSYWHELIVGLIARIIWVLAEETDTSLIASGMTTLRRDDLKIGVEPDTSFYLSHHSQLANKTEIDLTIDPPPDLAVEVEVTRRLSERKTIYREIGVPEIWVWDQRGLAILLLGDGGYVTADRSPSFPQMSAKELTGFILEGSAARDQTRWTKDFRARVREAIASAPPKA